jgi:hypothetical protein
MVNYFETRQNNLSNRKSNTGITQFDLEGALQAQMRSNKRQVKQQSLAKSTAGLNPAMQGFSKSWGESGSGSEEESTFGKAKGILGTAVGATVGNALKGLSKVLDPIGNIAVLGAEEFSEQTSALFGGARQFKSQTDENGKLTDLRSNWEKINDPRYGFGELMGDTWDDSLPGGKRNVWANTLGFVGDVGLDPTTYIAPGAGKFAGAGGRVTAANMLDEASKAAVVAGRAAPFTDEAIGKVAKFGVSSADDAMRAQLGMGKSGLRFGGRDGVRIAGTGKLADTVGGSASAARAKIMEGSTGKLVSKMRVNVDMADSMAIIQGRKAGNVKVALADLGSIDTKRLASGSLRQRFHDVDMLKGLRGLKHSGRRELTWELEEAAFTTNGKLALGTSEIALNASQKMDDLANLASSAGATGQGRIAGYVKHITTREGQTAMEHATITDIATGVKINTAQSKGAAFSRSLKAGTEYHVRVSPGAPLVRVKIEKGTIQEINQKIGGLFDDIKIFEDDFGLIWERTIDDAATDYGVAMALQGLQETHPEFIKSWHKLSGTAPTTRDEILARVGKDPATATRSQKKAAKRMATKRQEVVDGAWTEATQPRFNKWAIDGKLGPQLKQMVEEEFELLSTKLLASKDTVAIHPQLAQSFEQLADVAQKKWVWEVYDQYTRFFKTYATLSPGFHGRNGMSGIFMNISDGVGAADHYEAFALMKRWTKEGPTMLNDPDLPAYVKSAFEAAWGSGMAGNVSATEVGIGASGAWRDSLAKYAGGKVAGDVIARAGDNSATRFSTRVGTDLVEGPLRLAVSLNTMKRLPHSNYAAHVNEALTRITRLHFDYSQLSQMDQSMKRLIPFWTFMSRNLPLQIQQQFLNPKAYQQYNHLRKNFDMGEDGDVVPQQWDDMGAFKVLDGDNPIYAAPDLPFTRLDESVESFTNPLKFLSQFNPAMRVPGELIANRKAYSGNEFYPDENKWLYALSSMIPPIARGDSLSGGMLTGAVSGDEAAEYKSDNRAGSWLGFTGLPFKELTDNRYESELRRMARERR